MGVGNILAGNTNELNDSATQMNFVDGFYNTVTNGQHIYVLGSKNTVKNAVDGDNTKVNHSRLRVTATDTSYVWKPTLAAVFVGGPDANGKINTRRITYVAAGSADTDAVNVAQLTAATEMAGTSISLKAGDGIKLENDGSGNWTISTNYKDSGSDKVTYEEKNDNTAVPDAGGTETGNTDTGNADAGSTGTDINDTGKAVDAGRPAVIETKLTADDKGETKLEKDGKLRIIRSENIATARQQCQRRPQRQHQRQQSQHQERRTDHFQPRHRYESQQDHERHRWGSEPDFERGHQRQSAL